MLAELPVQEGEWVQAGGTLARVVQPGRLKAEVRIPQTQAQDIAVGQTAYIDTRNDTIQGEVARIDPAVQNAAVLIDVSLPGRSSPERPAGPQHRRDGGNRSPGGRDFCGPPGLRAGQQPGWGFSNWWRMATMRSV